MADMGADVIKVEQPSTGGDETRGWRIEGEGPFWHDEKGKSLSLYFAAVNRNKRSMTLNLKHVKGKEVIWRMLHEVDVVVNNFLPGTMERLGLGYEKVNAVNKGIIYASVSGFGATGPSSNRAGYDAIALAEAGLLHITGEANGPPTKPGIAMADLCTGIYAYGAICAALRGREINGQGCKIDGSLFESSLSLLINVGMGAINLNRTGSRYGLGHSSLVPYGGFQTKDDRYIFFCANNNKQWSKLCDVLDLEALSDDRFGSNDGRVNHREEVNNLINKRVREKTLQEWLMSFDGTGLPYGPINNVKEAFEHEQAKARDMVQSIEFDAAKDGSLKMIGSAMKIQGADVEVYRRPPKLGEHTEEVLEELGYSNKEIEELRAENVV